jgi:hypothetical protein
MIIFDIKLNVRSTHVWVKNLFKIFFNLNTLTRNINISKINYGW